MEFDLPIFGTLTEKCDNICYFCMLIISLLHAALQMSMQESAGEPSSQSDVSKVLEDQSFLSSILESVCPVEPSLWYYIYSYVSDFLICYFFLIASRS